MSAIPLGGQAEPGARTAGGRRARAAAPGAPLVPAARADVRAVILFAVIVFVAAAAPLLTSYNPIAQNLNATLLGPSAHHLLGTDQLGRDVFARLLYGLRTDLRIACIAVLFPFCSGPSSAAWPATSAAGSTR